MNKRKKKSNKKSKKPSPNKSRELKQRKQTQEYERQQKAIKVREYQLKKELEQEQKERLEMIEKKKRKRKIIEDQITRERIFKREEDLFRKRAEMVIVKKCEQEENAARFERTRYTVHNEKYYNVESKLSHETKAAKGKAREKFKEGKDQKKDAMTFGGQLLSTTVRAQPSWRKGL